MRKLLLTIKYSPFRDKPAQVNRLKVDQMRRMLTRIVVVSGIDLATAFQVDEANSSEEESRKQPEPRLLQSRN